MEVVFLGTGTSHGVPMIGCDCDVCRSSDPRNRRGRSCVHVVMNGVHIQVDAGPEFRLQCIENSVPGIDLFILTHGHADHLMGMDDLRRFCDRREGEALPVYSTQEALESVSRAFPYAVLDRAATRGYPAFLLREMPAVLEGHFGRISKTLLPHGAIEVLGLVFEEAVSGARFVYYTDCSSVSPAQRDMARGADLVVLDGLRQKPHPTHMTIDQATEVALDIAAPKTYLTHLTHTVDHAEVEAGLPPSVRLAYDGLRETLGSEKAKGKRKK